jgi:hypothetical protein
MSGSDQSIMFEDFNPCNNADFDDPVDLLRLINCV